MVTFLPIIVYKGKEYFVDDRLSEFRSNTMQIEFVRFDTTKGKRMLREYRKALRQETAYFLYFKNPQQPEGGRVYLTRKNPNPERSKDAKEN